MSSAQVCHVPMVLLAEVWEFFPRSFSQAVSQPGRVMPMVLGHFRLPASEQDNEVSENVPALAEDYQADIHPP